MIIKGLIQEVDCCFRVIKVSTKYRMYYIKLGKSLYNKIKTFLGERNIIILDIKRAKKDKYFLANYILKIFSLDNQYLAYDSEFIDKTLGDFFKNHKNLMFLDLEFSMQEFNVNDSFTPEIIQVGYLLYGPNQNEILRYNQYVKPTKGKLSIRTCKFLNINNNYFFKKAISPQVVYRDLVRVIKKYDPHIIVYGRNDILAIKNFYKINNLPSLDKYTRFVNICSLLKNYYNLENTIGLFDLYARYYHKDLIQDHNAYSDAFITSKIYYAFKDDCLKGKKSIHD